MFKVFPGTFTSDNRKVPIKEAAGWKDISTNDPTIIKYWQDNFGYKIKFWAVPTGAINNILVLDVDVKGGGLETIKNYHVPKTLSQTTLSGGKHYVFKYPNDGRVYGNKVGFAPGLDIRGEGGYIAHYQFDNTPIAEAPEWLIEEAIAEQKLEINPDDAVKIAPEIVKEILDDACENIRTAPEGESNNVLNVEAYRVGQLLTSNSLDKDTAFSRLFEAAKYRGKPDYEATATINSGLAGGVKTPMVCPFGNEEPKLIVPVPEAPENDRWTPRFFTKYDLTNLSKLRKPQVFKNWSTEDIHITTADGGTGKTTLKLVEAISLALGRDFLGFECKGEGRTLFITGEDTKEKIGAMIGAILKQMEIIDNKELVDKVMNNILVKKDADLCLIAKDRQGFINLNDKALEKVLQAVEDLRPKLIVFDPISSFWGSESALNDMSKAVAKFMGELVERSNACVEVINHMGKASSKDKDMTQFAGRGGTGLPSHSRVSRVLRPVFYDEYLELTGQELPDDESAMLCNVNKFSDGSPLYNKPFLIKRKGYLFERVAIVEGKETEEEQKMSDTERVFSFIKQERNDKRYPNKQIVIAHFMALRDKIAKERVQRAIEMLLYQGHLGEKIKLIDNPDIEQGGKVFIVTDMKGNEG